MTRLEFFRNMGHLSPGERFRRFMAFRLAPVISGLKPAELVNLCPGAYDLHAAWKSSGEKTLSEFGLDWFTLRERSDCACILVHKKENLHAVIKENEGKPVLARAKYPAGRPDETLETLKSRFQSGCPHEIGLFLGIPYDDVASFISHNGENYLFYGYWKVYSEPVKAKRLFADFDASKKKSIEFSQFDKC